MGREIKFRAWDSKEGKWLEDSEYIAYIIWLDGTTSKYDSMFERMEPQQCILEQFTGRHDKHGKEIWEGDIVRCSWGKYGDCDILGTVKWDNEYAMFIVDTTDESIGTMGQIEVIGNIHENEELIHEPEKENGNDF